MAFLDVLLLLCLHRRHRQRRSRKCLSGGDRPRAGPALKETVNPHDVICGRISTSESISTRRPYSTRLFETTRFHVSRPLTNQQKHAEQRTRPRVERCRAQGSAASVAATTTVRARSRPWEKAQALCLSAGLGVCWQDCRLRRGTCARLAARALLLPARGHVSEHGLLAPGEPPVALHGRAAHVQAASGRHHRA